MSGRRSFGVPRTEWRADELERDRLESIAQFRRERLDEPLGEYLDHFDRMRAVLDNLVANTAGLTLLESQAVQILADPDLLDAFRYLAGPPISVDDLKTLADANSLALQVLQSDQGLVRRLVGTILTGLDQRRFPWVGERRDPSPAEREAAIIATAALIATRRTETIRRNAGKLQQEQRVRQALLECGLREVDIPSKRISTTSGSPMPGEFTTEVAFGERKADIVVGLWDTRKMPIECKVSNSSVNSVKRLNNDAAVKAEVWIADFGSRNVVPTAVLSGVYKLHNLEQAQSRGLTLYWAHRLSDLTEWIERTRPHI